jgi:ATP-dependent DNA helicase RecG
VDLLVGTHALLEEGVVLPGLALAVVDEQHRFGVRQRVRLRRTVEGENVWKSDQQNGMVPHLLVLSATPIPRTMALTLYGDLDLVTLDELPPGRKPVLTQVCLGIEGRQQAYAAIKHAVAEGGQAFVVCPAIHAASDKRRTSALALGRALRTTLKPARIGILHGQLCGEEQRKVLAGVHTRDIDVLVATTVLEVGVDVPAARIMVVEDAENFGLAQLHQLRGRVGRGAEQASCCLLTSSSDPEVLARLRFLAAHTDGFAIAEEDLRRRGAGDLQGTRQAGAPTLHLSDLTSYAGLVETARREAEAVLDEDPELRLPAHAGLRRAVEERWQRAQPFGEEAG